jgi:S-adenosylmethionine:tRNA ribosyltransferase-isomerase
MLEKLSKWFDDNGDTVSEWGDTLFKAGEKVSRFFSDKVNGLMKTVKSMTQSPEWKNAGSIWEKMSISWNKIIAEPFGVWEALVKPARRLKAGTVVEFPPSPVQAEILEELEQDGGRRIKFHNCADIIAFLNEYGHIPLPPYIDRPAEKMDIYRYQTVYARAMGSVAAPTAGLHFTSGLLSDLGDRGIKIARVLLHVGLGTFRPVTAGDIRQHKMHKEYYELDQQTADLLNNTRAAGKKIVAVGTTVVRTLETVCDEQGTFKPGQGNTDIFIYPGYKFKAADKIITNFHLPGSSLIMLVAAFAGIDKVLEAYQYAIDNKFRFYSFGDAMMVL